MIERSLQLASDIDIFYFFFGLLRQTIWKVEPKMKKVMLSK